MLRLWRLIDSGEQLLRPADAFVLTPIDMPVEKGAADNPDAEGNIVAHRPRQGCPQVVNLRFEQVEPDFLLCSAHFHFRTLSQFGKIEGMPPA